MKRTDALNIVRKVLPILSSAGLVLRNHPILLRTPVADVHELVDTVHRASKRTAKVVSRIENADEPDLLRPESD